MAIQRPSFTAKDLSAFHFPINVDPAKLFIDPKGFLSDVDKEMKNLFLKVQENLDIFKSSPFEGARRIWTQIAGHPATFSAKIGIISNFLIAAGSLMGNPIMVACSLIGSTAAHIIGGEEAKHAERLEKILEEFKKANKDLEQSVKVFKKENETLNASNQQLRRNVADLKRNIHVLETHLSALQHCNDAFKQNLGELNRCIEELKSANTRGGVRIESISGIEKSFSAIGQEIVSFSSRLRDTQEILSGHKEEISERLGTLGETMRVINEKISELRGIPELSLICSQVSLALAGMQQYQGQIRSTNEELLKAQKRCAEEHAELVSTRKSCEAMLAKFETYFGEKRSVHQTALRVHAAAALARS